MPTYFSNRETCFDWVRKKGEEYGFVMIIGRSDNPGSRRSYPRMTLVCERWGTYKDKPISLSSQESIENEFKGKKKEKRKSGTKKCDCKFQLNARQVNEDGQWKLKVICGVHNHPIYDSMLGHSYAGRLQKDEEDYVIAMSNANSRPKDILCGLKVQFPENKSTVRNIYNARLKNKSIEHAGRTQMQQLMFRLNGHRYHFEYRQCEQTGQVNQLFFAHPDSIKLLRAFPNILFMDCTYKTNRYNLPLLEIVGVTSTNMTFLVAAVYLEAEKEANYTWACEVLKSMMDESCIPNVIVTDCEKALMNAIRRTFPTTIHLLCRWHISKNIVTKCKKMFDMQEKWESFIQSWHALVKADTETEFNDCLRRLPKDFKHYPDAVEYVMKQWIVPYKERFVSCWTNKVLHFENLTTNRYVNFIFIFV